MILGKKNSNELWDGILKRMHRSSICAKCSFMQCKLIHRTHYTKAWLSKIYDDVSPACDMRHHIPADVIHMFWLCPSLGNYWTKVFNTLAIIIDVKLNPKVLSALFGVSPSLPLLSSSKKNAIIFTLLARKLILMKWKSWSPPSHSHGMWDVLYLLKLEKIRLSLHGTANKFKI